MDIVDILHQISEDAMRSYGLADLAVGTVTSEKPLEVKVREDMAALPEETLWLTVGVIEKKIPVLKHTHITAGFKHDHELPDISHEHEVSGLSHSHSGEEGETGSALEGSYSTETALNESFQTETSLNQDAFESDERLTDIFCLEDGKKLPVKDGYIILNRGLEKGDKVLMLRVCRGQQFIILSRIFERGAQSAAKD